MDQNITPLSWHERRFLWYLSQGFTITETGAELGTSSGAARQTMLRIRTKTGARTEAHAVSLALRREIIGQRDVCGGSVGYRRHVALREDLCPACRRYRREWADRQGVSGRISFDSHELRLLRDMEMCGPLTSVLPGVAQSTLSRRLTDLYRKLDVAHLPHPMRRQEALEEARMRGLLPYVRPVRKAPPGERRRPSDRLTDLEVRTLRALANGQTLAQGSIDLGIPRDSLGSRLTHIYRKLRVQHLPRKEKRQAALKEARNQGYAV